jgi:hypothetical protein
MRGFLDVAEGRAPSKGSAQSKTSDTGIGVEPVMAKSPAPPDSSVGGAVEIK